MTWCEWQEGCDRTATCQVVTIRDRYPYPYSLSGAIKNNPPVEVFRVESVWYLCDLHGGPGGGRSVARLDEVGTEGYDFMDGVGQGMPGLREYLHRRKSEEGGS